MIVRAGGYVVDSRLGALHVDRQLDAAQVELIVRAIERVGWEPKHVTEVELTEGDVRVRRVRCNGDGQPIVDEARLP